MTYGSGASRSKCTRSSVPSSLRSRRIRAARRSRSVSPSVARRMDSSTARTSSSSAERCRKRAAFRFVRVFSSSNTASRSTAEASSVRPVGPAPRAPSRETAQSRVRRPSTPSTSSRTAVSSSSSRHATEGIARSGWRDARADPRPRGKVAPRAAELCGRGSLGRDENDVLKNGARRERRRGACRLLRDFQKSRKPTSS